MLDLEFLLSFGTRSSYSFVNDTWSSYSFVYDTWSRISLSVVLGLVGVAMYFVYTARPCISLSVLLRL